MKNKNKKMTLDKLAGMISRRFDDIEDEMVTKNEFSDFRSEINKRLDKVEYQVDEVYDILKRFEENDILNLQKRVQILEKAVRALASHQPPK